MRYLKRKEILAGNYKWPDCLVKLKPTKHVLSRLEERCVGLECLPTMVKATKANIAGALTADGINLFTVTVRLNYHQSCRFMYLCFNPINGILITVWFKEKVFKKHLED